jgi:hypothetical protein
VFAPWAVVPGACCPKAYYLEKKPLAFLSRLGRHAAASEKYGDADKLMLNRFVDLHGGHHDAVTAAALSDMYDTLEKLIDHCREAGNLFSQLVLKHS